LPFVQGSPPALPLEDPEWLDEPEAAASGGCDPEPLEAPEVVAASGGCDPEPLEAPVAAAASRRDPLEEPPPPS
jgi:hypothetical protein